MSPKRRSASVLSTAGIMLAAALTAACAGTGSDKPQDSAPKAGSPSVQDADAGLSDKLPADIKAKGTIKVASNVEYPPFEYYDTDNTTIIGLDKNLADALGVKLGVKLEFTNMGFDSIIPALAAKRFDMAMSAMTDNAERRKQVDFVDYFVSGGGFLVKKGNPHNVQTLGDVCGLTVAIDKGTTNVEDAEKASKDCVATGKAPVKADIYPGTSKIVLALQNGRADIAMLDTSAAAYIAQQNASQFEVPGESYAPKPYGIVFPKGSTQLQQAVKAGLEALIADGTYEKVLAKWGQEVGAIKQITINDGATS
ncbi:MAG: ABC transporter substrate-binding protein [Intrasporangium sp.]|uniref:ABC transporter substrate-binding protein n=1 Tax=Intrasporangium sp. TaxID=1925024 RepID=UPI0026486BF6|nr:ABC transporter substrate-binding protein [Intrasporangium sp.]MDN5797583.1 ABC transporter substrate-binding protein [Intrasporangium sp.]